MTSENVTLLYPAWRISLPDLLALQDVLDEIGNIFACPSFVIYSLDFLD
jgi:hypothetical protein